MEASISLTWDPEGRGVPPVDPPEGDMRGVLADLDDALREEGDDDYETLLAAKAITLFQLGRREEAELVVGRLLENLVGTDDGDLRPLVLAEGRVRVATGLADRGEYAAAERALGDVASFYEGDHDPAFRSVAARALACHIHALFPLGDGPRIRLAWEELRTSYGGELDPRIRRHVARGGVTAALGLSNARCKEEASATAEEVIELYRSDTDPTIRADVAVAMWMQARWWWPFPRIRANRDFADFLGSDPEPEIIEALRHATPKADRILRYARQANAR
jgi:tetratricopeptide (TPR) repeat protein